MQMHDAFALLRASTAGICTDGRTDGLTENPTHLAQPLGLSNAHEFKAATEVSEGERYPVIRTGERAEIPLDVRRAVYRRDGGRCKFCGDSFEHARLELDHIIPWSAGGSDFSSNLRTLCQRCNGDRSNRRLYGDGGRVLPVTWWCIDYHSPGDDPWWEPHRPEWVRPAPPPITSRERMTFAYCAQCDINGYAEVAL